MTLPEKFAARVLSELGPEEGAALCAALDTEPPVSVRLNPAKCAGAAEPGAVQDGTGAAPGGYGSPQGSSGTDVPAPLPVLQNADGRVPWCADGYYLAVRPQFTFDSDFHAGAYYVQEASSQFVGRLMGGEGVAGKRILDLCAAPGGKTTLYASLAGPDGLVVANEIDRRRAQVLADNVRKWGTGNVAVTTCEPRQLGDFEAWFDMVAVDAPCSGEGMFRKDAQARAEWSEGNVKLCAARQDGILREAWRALKPGGRLIYSTCTFNRDEDEGALERMLAWAGDEVAEAEDMAVREDMRILVDRAILEDRPRIAVVGQHIHRLLNAAPEEVDLQIERPAVHVLVEIADVGVVALLEVGFGVVTLGQNPGQRGLPASDIACNGYIHIIRYLFYILNTARPLRTAAGVLRNGASRHYAAAKRAVTSFPRRTPVSRRPHDGR